MPSLASMVTERVEVPTAALQRGSGSAVVHSAHWPAAEGAPPDAPVQVCLHGLGGSHLNWALIGEHLAERGPVWAPDLAGFGLTVPSTRTASVGNNIDLVIGFLRTISPGRPVLLLGNSMGGHIAYSVAARRPDLVAGLVLIGPAVPPASRIPDPVVAARFLAFATPLVGRAFLARRERRTTPAEQVHGILDLCVTDVSALDPDLLDAHVGMAVKRRRMAHAHGSFLTAARSLLRRLSPPRQARLWAAIDRIQAPALILQGSHDRVTEQAGCDRLAGRRRDWSYTVYDGLGHVVMLEDPKRVAADIAAWRDAALPGSGSAAG